MQLPHLTAGATIPARAAPDSSRRAEGLFAAGVLLLAALVAATFGQVAHFAGPILDDDHAIALNPHIGSLSLASLRWVVLPDFRYNPRFMPAGWLGVDLETRITGLNPFRMHLYVLALHALNCAVLACVLRRFVANLGARGVFSLTVAPLAGAAFYAVHPMRAETLGWVSLGFWHQSVLFALAWAWLRTGRWRPVLEGAAYLLCLLSFPAFLGLAPAAFAVDAIRQGWREALRRNAFLLAAAAACGGATLYAVRVTTPHEDRAPIPIALQAVQLVAVEGHVLVKSVLPMGLEPFVKPFHDLRRGDPAEAAGCLAFVALWLAALFPRGRFLLPWMAAFTLLVAPFAWTANWQDPDIGDRYATACHVLLSAAIACALCRLCAPAAFAGAAASAGVLAFALLGHSQIRAWEDDLTLQAHVERNVPPGDITYQGTVAVVRSESAVCHYLRGDYQAALDDIDSSLRFSPGNPDFKQIRGKIEGMRAAALARLKTGGAGAPSPRAMEHWGIAAEAIRADDWTKAQIHLDEVRRLDPRYYDWIRSE